MLETINNDFIKSLGYLIYNFNLFVIIGIYGFYQLFTTQPRIVWFILTASLAVYGFSTFYAVSDNYVFFIPFNILFAILIGVGLSKIQNKIMLKSLSFIAFLIPLFYIFSFNKIVSIFFIFKSIIIDSISFCSIIFYLYDFIAIFINISNLIIYFFMLS